MFAGGVFLDALLDCQEKGAESSIILNFFTHAPLLMRDHVRLYFPELCGVSETATGHARQASATTFRHGSLVTKADDSATTGSARCCF